ncbi:MAG: hypothetical protein A4E24_01563 [Methanomethylovorans sp. PtaU1.Bin093]|jgi:hypothetical protein|uniref:hypothetical protein n=1 Tax=Methanomethylovorans sp. PtaU1.Bin093 TaxID=1811679 RepID=UPI0009C4C2DB|nr:hypothetical protein [Methanomethylovorans sp. PtaU1.Bin093]OPY19618.1 MAG: hypothetical protein A4E24_01563 [Methanomethylovorans sp. PtaU1.Bin093]
MAKLPMKSRLAQILYEQKEAWDYELISKLLSEYGKSGDYWKWMARFWMAEFSCGGIFNIVDVAADDGKHFAKGKVLYRYNLTDFGKARINELLGA